jgi:hypothetical protein
MLVSQRPRLLATSASAPLVPPFTEETARAKVKAAENLWNTKDPSKVPPHLINILMI